MALARTIRSQVTEGLMLAAPIKAAVAASFAQDHVLPATLTAAGVDANTSGQYTESIEVDGGTILIRFGKRAHKSIAGGTLTLHPAVTQDQEVAWACGYNTNVPGEIAYASTAETDLPPKYLPSSCRLK